MKADRGHVVFRVDASARSGTGHVMRCLALADRLRLGGVSSHFVCRHMPDRLHEKLIASGHGFEPLFHSRQDEPGDLAHSAWLGASQRVDADQTLAIVSRSRCDWLVVDHYALDARWESALRPFVGRLMVIDDLADRTHDCDLLLDQSASIDPEARYSGKVASRCRLLLGYRYALLREEFRELRSHVRSRDGSVRRVLVFLGGVDAAGYTMVAIGALRKLRLEDLQVDVVVGSQNSHREAIEEACRSSAFGFHAETEHMARLMASADLAVGAGGTATWERCCMGLPTLALCVADNQEQLVKDSVIRGLIYAPDLKQGGEDAMALHLRALMDNRSLLRAMSERGMQEVDGLGTRRVMREMGFAGLTVRKATSSDSEKVFSWRNHPDVRVVSRNPEPIKPSVHANWFAGVLADENKLLLLGEDKGESVGVIRFDVEDFRAEVSIYLDPRLKGRGYGPDLLSTAEAWLATNRPEVSILTAEVLGDNSRSRALFETCGFRRQATSYSKEIGRI